jgi:hypothetical protein
MILDYCDKEYQILEGCEKSTNVGLWYDVEEVLDVGC